MWFNKCRLISGTCRNVIRRSVSTWESSFLRYAEHGDPAKVLRLETEQLSQNLFPSHVAVKFLASPINPADINTVQGVYAIKPPLPSVGGSEGVAEVIAVGAGVADIKVGDRVIPANPATGTWRTYSVVPQENLLKIPADLPIAQAATLAVNPCTAYRMLHDFASLRPGDVVVQNGANSAVGQAVIQIAAHNKWKTINIIRDRPNKADVAQQLASLGATYVITDADFKRSQLIEDLPKARVGFNCVGGKAVSDLIKILEPGATLVTYGGMSKQPMIVPTTAMIFKDIILCGFWMTRYNSEVSLEARSEMLDSVVAIMKAGKLQPPLLEPVLLKDFRGAMERSQEGFVGRKQLLVMDDSVFSQVKKDMGDLQDRCT
ncbi:enoyl-[acyl-carrier-protein] reductase, mitochondrial-like [Paramacrobiotus metropolitanus]|uniref:enoyl-[acyl-carrier-protein] reductase, mitochondrial-like n=1 Tax=Paramacrobiotus metropolitanus TaxID=2943436 RepID=UPI002446092E|nr:enoyl-[acyl-carrier-protein] reductase, mitochondrial-like [Paramacrobiotus metropolitanus]